MRRPLHYSRRVDKQLSSASLLGRGLLRLGDARATGTLSVRGVAQARIALHAGRVVAVEVDGGPMLGDLLEVDPTRHRQALGQSAPVGPVGRWLVREGLADPHAVAHALRRQMRARIAKLFAWSEVELRFLPVGAPLPALDEPLTPTDLVLGALRDVARPSADTEARLRSTEWTLSSLGRSQLPRAELFPQERAMLIALERGTLGGDVLALGGGHPRALRALFAWHLVGLVAERRLDAATRDHRHQALLRARRSLRRDGAVEHDDRALRRVLRDVHPDRFESRLKETCTDVVRELLATRARRA